MNPRPGPESPAPAHGLDSPPAPSKLFVGFLLLLAVLLSACFLSTFLRRLLSLLRHPSAPLTPLPPYHHRRPAARGMDPAVVGSLPVLTYVGPSGSGECCAVCLGELQEKAQVKVIPRCGHVYHPGCIDRWLLARGSCPVCRCASDILMGPDARRGQEEEERAGHGQERTRG